MRLVGSKWKLCSFSIKKNLERQRKLKILDKEYEMVWSRMRIKYEIR